MEEPRAQPRRIDESTILISGGSSGLGLASALRFARSGAPRIALLARNEERGRAAVERVREASADAEVLFVPADVTDVTQVFSAVERVHEEFGSIDVLLSASAATVDPELLFRISPEAIAHLLTAPSLPPIYLTRAVFPIMREQKGGSVVLVGSDASKIPTPGESVLGAAMAAISMFARGAALEGRRDGIRVNVVTPSIIGGTATTERWLREGFSKKLFQAAIDAAAFGVVDADELAELVLFLAGPGAAKMTGQTISMNGGISVA